MELWITKTKIQSQWMKKYPTQILKQAKRVWETSIHRGDGRAWVYFIFAICQWLPTNYCLYRKLPDGDAKTSCLLCLGRKTETADHFFDCPALDEEVRQLKESVQRILCESKFPFASLPVPPWRENLISNWVAAAGSFLSKFLTLSKLQRMALDFFYANSHKQFIEVRHFVVRVATAIREQAQGARAIPECLLTCLASCFNLEVEGNTDVLHRCVAFTEWYSRSPNDTWFGSKGNPLQLTFRGKNTYLDILGESRSFITQMQSSILTQLDSLEPTRIVMVGELDLFDQFSHDKRVVQLARMEKKNLSNVLLAWNKKSTIFDPISWSMVISKLREWAEAWDCKLQISDHTNSLFQERSLPTHPCRIQTLPSSTPHLLFL